MTSHTAVRKVYAYVRFQPPQTAKRTIQLPPASKANTMLPGGKKIRLEWNQFPPQHRHHVLENTHIITLLPL